MIFSHVVLIAFLGNRSGSHAYGEQRLLPGRAVQHGQNLNLLPHLTYFETGAFSKLTWWNRHLPVADNTSLACGNCSMASNIAFNDKGISLFSLEAIYISTQQAAKICPYLSTLRLFRDNWTEFEICVPSSMMKHVGNECRTCEHKFGTWELFNDELHRFQRQRQVFFSLEAIYRNNELWRSGRWWRELAWRRRWRRY